MKSNMKKPIICVDMDNVLCDYRSLYIEKIKEYPQVIYPQSQYGYFLELKPMPFAIEAFNWMVTWADVWILTAPSYMNPNCLAEKNYWVRQHLGIEYTKKIIMAHDKSMVKGDYLIDDGIENRQKEFDGVVIEFGSKRYLTWTEVYLFLKKEAVKNKWLHPKEAKFSRLDKYSK